MCVWWFTQVFQDVPVCSLQSSLPEKDLEERKVVLTQNDLEGTYR